MRKYLIFLPFVVWAIICVALKITGIVGWWFATSFLWLPAGAGISALTIIYGTALWGAKLKERRAAKEKPSCSNCLFEKYRKIMSESQCMGEKNEQVKTEGICSYWKRTES